MCLSGLIRCMCMKLRFGENRYFMELLFCQCLVLVANSVFAAEVMVVNQIPDLILSGGGRGGIGGCFSPVLWHNFSLLLFLEFQTEICFSSPLNNSVNHLLCNHLFLFLFFSFCFSQPKRILMLVAKNSDQQQSQMRKQYKIIF